MPASLPTPGPRDVWGDDFLDWLRVHGNEDGSLKSDAVQTALGGGSAALTLFNTASDWAIATKYLPGEYVINGGTLYKCTTAHTSTGTFDATKWADLGAAPDVEPIRRVTLRGEPSDDTDASAQDTTPHLTFESYQRPPYVGATLYPFGENIRFKAMRPHSKQMLSWWFATDPSANPDDATNPMQPMVWAHAHYYAQTDPAPGVPLVHGHWEIEVPRADMGLQGVFAIDFIDQATKSPGVDITNAYFAHANLSIRQGEGEILRVCAGAGSNERVIEFSADDQGGGVESPGFFDPLKRRWWLVTNQTAESGGNVGADWELRSWTDDGGTATTVIFAKRSNGNVTFGSATDASYKLALVYGNDAGGVLYKPSASPTSSKAAFAAQVFTAGDRVLDSRVQADANPRLAIDSNGKHSWGNGTAAVDITMQRAAAHNLALGAADTFTTGKNATGSRPAANAFASGAQFYDTTLSKPIWSDGTVWRDAAGTAV